jgi:hypothetical protein
VNFASFHTRKSHGPIYTAQSKALNYLTQIVLPMHAPDSELLTYFTHKNSRAYIEPAITF